MKVLMLTTNNSLLDGINRHILRVASALNQLEGVSVAVCITQPKGELYDALQKAGIETFTLNARNGHRLPILWRFWKVMRTFKPDIVHGHVIAFFVGVVLKLCFNKCKKVITIHGIGDHFVKVPSEQKRKKKLGFGLGSIRRFLTPRMDYTCYISKGVERAFAGSQKSHSTVYNPMDVKSLDISRFQVHDILGLSHETPLIGTACRFAEQKAPLVFTSVMCKILQSRTEMHAAIMGSGEAIVEAKMRSIVEACGVAERFHFLGYQENASQLVASLNCFIMTSHWEGLPTTLLEAMVVGTPIAFMEGEGGLIDLAEMNRSEEGPFAIVVPKGEIVQMAEKILQLLENKSEAQVMTQRARALSVKYFSTEQVVRQLQAIYRLLLQESIK